MWSTGTRSNTTPNLTSSVKHRLRQAALIRRPLAQTRKAPEIQTDKLSRLKIAPAALQTHKLQIQVREERSWRINHLLSFSLVWKVREPFNKIYMPFLLITHLFNFLMNSFVWEQLFSWFFFMYKLPLFLSNYILLCSRSVFRGRVMEEIRPSCSHSQGVWQRLGDGGRPPPLPASLRLHSAHSDQLWGEYEFYFAFKWKVGNQAWLTSGEL